MAERSQVYKCELCGNIIEVLTGADGELICCGQPMILLDELCSGTNPSEAAEIVAIVLRLVRKLSPVAFVTTHFLDLARSYGKRLIGLRDGRMVYDGDIENVTDETFREIYGRAVTPDDLLEGAE